MKKPDQKYYIAIDLKSFYASVECVERGLDPLDTNLVVADSSRTDKTICLAVSPPLKARGISGRPRLFEVMRQVRQINRGRGNSGSSVSESCLKKDLSMAVDYIVAPPRMALYIDYSTRIYRIYMRHVAPEDIHVYSIDEVFIDITPYLATAKSTPHDMAVGMIREIMEETGITATAGIGTNLYLAKVAMDIVAKHMPPDKDGVRLAMLDEQTYRRRLWGHKPLTDFWRIGRGTARRLAEYGLFTMGDVARCSIGHENLLYRIFGVNAELLIDHAWGWEPVTMAQIKAYRPSAKSTGCGQVLMEAYPADRARTVALEMAETVALDLLAKHLVAKAVTLHVGYDRESLVRPEILARYDGPVDVDHYGRLVPRHAHGSAAFARPTSSVRSFQAAVAETFDRIVNGDLLVRRITLTAVNVVSESEMETGVRQLCLFDDYNPVDGCRDTDPARLERERRLNSTVIGLKKLYGKNAILKGLNFADGATQRDRNRQIGGHKA